MNGDIDAVLWDFGGVFTTSPFEAFARFEAQRGLPKNFIRSINSRNPDSNAWARFESSAIDAEAFDAAFREEARERGHDVGGKEVLELLSGEFRPRMARALAECARHYKVGCITNNMKQAGAGPAMAANAARAQRAAELMAQFDVVVESSVEGVRKPDPEIYRIACKRLDVEPSRAVFLDDLGINLKPARAMGMATIKVVTENQAIEELASVTGLELV